MTTIRMIRNQKGPSSCLGVMTNILFSPLLCPSAGIVALEGHASAINSHFCFALQFFSLDPRNGKLLEKKYAVNLNSFVSCSK